MKHRTNTELAKFTKDTAEAMGVEMDDRLVNHIGFLTIRDPMVIFKDKIKVDNETNTNHFEVNTLFKITLFTFISNRVSRASTGIQCDSSPHHHLNLKSDGIF